MDQWLDSLSEDWISQPRSPQSSSLVKEIPSPSSAASQSRIPRYKPRSTSTLSITSKAKPVRPNPLRRSSVNETALKEKSSSNINASQKCLPNGQIKPQIFNATSMRLRGRHASTGSSNPGQLDTVQYKSSPVKEKNAQATPEWKRRVLKENGGGDLFSPIGLESVFKPPTVNANFRPQPKGEMKHISQSNIPLSPLPLPSIGPEKHNAPRTNFQKPAAAAPSQTGAHEVAGYAEHIPERSAIPPPREKPAKGEDIQIAKSEDVMGCSSPSPRHSPPLTTVHPPRPSSASKPSTSKPSLDCGDNTGLSSAHDKSGNEDISPYFVSRCNMVDGRVEYAAVDRSMRRLRSEMNKLRLQQQNIPSSRSSDQGINYTESRPSERTLLHGQLDEVTSQSLPDDLSMGTDAYIANGGFVSIHRGGYSNDGSFQKRPVSPSLLPDLDGPSLKSRSSTSHDVIDSPALPEHFSQTKSKTPSSQPQTPKNENFGRPDSYERPRSSGSPLKLFDKYNTFTNDRLARRISKFEQTLNQELDAESLQEPSSPSPRRRRPYKPSPKRPLTKNPKSRRISSFGDGELDGREFALHHPSASNISLEQIEQNIDHRSSPRERSNGAQSKLSMSRHSAVSETNKSKNSKNSKRRTGGSPEKTPGDGNTIGDSRARGSRDHNSQISRDEHEGLRTTTAKRLPYSPVKDPAPKRRRTLQASTDLDQVSTATQQVEVKEMPAQHVHGRKRKDALYDNDCQVADPNTIAKRQILQPRVPGPAQNSSSTKPRVHGRVNEPLDGEEESHSNDPRLGHNPNSAIDPPTEIVAGALATVALNTMQDITYGCRKASVTTADFFNEAQQIMQLIRAKGRPRSSHTTAETSQIEQTTIPEESVMDDSTKDEFSRPPSRERNDLPQREPERLDARVVSQLRKFEDEDDLGLALSSSLKVLQIHQSLKDPEPLASDDPKNEDRRVSTECDPSGIRIREGLTSSSEDASFAGTEVRHQSQSSQSNSGPSSSRSNPTTSSQGSTKRMVIAPETVAHLLSDQMAGMVFDREKQLWVKRKSSPNAGGIESFDQPASEDTEEDLFGDIPDLSIDEMKELQTVKEAVTSMKLMGSAVDKIVTRDQLTPPDEHNRALHSHKAAEDARPRTADGKLIEPVETSSAPSKYSHFASSGPVPGTRATSWGDELEPTKEPQLPTCAPSRTSTNLNNEPAEEVEHEISILEGRNTPTSRHQNKFRRARVVTVAFSSPLVDQREFSCEEDDCSQAWDGGSESGITESPATRGSHRKPSSTRHASFGILSKSTQRRAPRRASLSNQSYIARPMSRLDERDEMSLAQCSTGDHHMTMEVAISTPLPLSRSLLLPPPTTDQRSSVGFHLSPLSEFTLHQVDKPIDPSLSHVARLRGVRVQEADTKLSLAAEDLVKKLTDLEPYEPYWDYLRSVDLHDRDLKTLHMLEEFCGRVEELDVSNNQIGDLDGIPHSARLLNIRGNRLSDLAAWNSLQNLQYLDVTGNQLRSLEGFQYLIHLRALKAENNGIETLVGLEDLDGMTSLSLRGNRLRTVDFDKFNLRRLTHMDLRENVLTDVSNLHRLTATETCDLSHNALEALDFSISNPLTRLRTLNVSNNRLSFLDLTELPNIKTLNLDKNSIASIESLSSLKNLETLSWREQTLNSTYGHSEIQYQHCREVRNLYLSGNPLSMFVPSAPFLNLQHLELASTGLQGFSSDFGYKCPNLRIVNINYNAIRDLSPLLGIVKLQKLFIAGNRLARLRRTMYALRCLSKALLEVDMRNNPLTVGFYTPQEPAREDKCVVLQRRNGDAYSDEEDPEAKRIQAFLLPALNEETDYTLRERLDQDTKLRRRVHELLTVNACPNLERLDGLDVNMKVLKRRDGVWERLVELGIIDAKAMRERED